MKNKLAILALLALSGCESSNQKECFDSVVKAYPNAVVQQLPGKDYKFIIIEKDKTIRYVETLSLGAEVTYEYTIRPYPSE